MAEIKWCCKQCKRLNDIRDKRCKDCLKLRRATKYPDLERK